MAGSVVVPDLEIRLPKLPVLQYITQVGKVSRAHVIAGEKYLGSLLLSLSSRL